MPQWRTQRWEGSATLPLLVLALFSASRLFAYKTRPVYGLLAACMQVAQRSAGVMASVTSFDDDVTASAGPSSWQPWSSESRDSSSAYEAVLGVLLGCCLLVVTALTVYLCSSVAPLCRRRVPQPPAEDDHDDVIDHVTTPTALTSLGGSSSSGRNKEATEEVSAKTGLLRSLLLGPTTSAHSGVSGAEGEVTWYGSRDVEVGRPTNIRYVSLRHSARQSSSIESDTGAAAVTTPTSQVGKRLTPLLPKRFGFVGWTRTANATPAPAAAPPVDAAAAALRQPSASEQQLHATSQEFSDGCRLAARYVPAGCFLPVWGGVEMRVPLYPWGFPISGHQLAQSTHHSK